ncbi:SDR family NAD(P)-dependent oxidoreductase, partial [Nocardiopsis quinghaiensis]|uniref:SDR family NAD(P)-dependent oxidoreductase n=1 Tax=Nocardiopsis quinghaiensis TaxID=464995 RepID=UPI0012391155
LANRVSHFLDLRGPSMTIDTLCSSSLVALHQAVRSIRAGECDQALVAGVRLALSPLHYHAMSSLKALSPTGRSRAFDADADGFVPGEGVITLLLKPLHQALHDHDHIHTLIKGTAVNHGGRTSGLTVPNSTAQQHVITAALEDARTHPDTITLLEAHGTGTPLGDPIEIEGLTHAYRDHTQRHQYCAIGSIKTNIGHLEPAAGLAGLTKIILAMRHKTIPPTLHLNRPNPALTLETTPFYTTTQPTPWHTPPNTPRRAGLSAFGMGGVNAHIILQEPPTTPERSPVTVPGHVLRVSGATEAAVRELAAAYAERIEACRDQGELADVCHTINTGRAELELQAAVLGADAGALAGALREVAVGGSGIVAVRGPAGDRGPLDPAAAADLVRRGYTGIDWAALSGPQARTVPDVPTYPFAARGFWATRDGDAPPQAEQEEASASPATTETTETTETTGVTLPRAERTRWRGAPAPSSEGAGGEVALVCAADDPLYGALRTRLTEAGYTLSPDPSRTGHSSLVVVDPGPEHFWEGLREWTAAVASGGHLLWIARGSAAVSPDELSRLSPAAASRGAAVLAAGAESRLTATAVDLDPGADPPAAAREVVADLTAGPGGRVALRDGLRYTPRREEADAGPVPDLSGDGFLLVTGGAGAVGRLMVRRLAELGARRIGIVGRSRLDAAAVADLTGLAPSSEVAYMSCDVSEAEELRAVVHKLSLRWGSLAGIVHASGRALPFGSHRRRSGEDAARTLAPKTTGSDNVLSTARERRAGFVVLVSSVAGDDPAAGRGLVDYAMANAYQLALAEHAGAEDGPTVVTAHAWPDWSGVGLDADASFSATASLGTDEALAGFAAHLLSGGRVSFPGSSHPVRTGEEAVARPPLTAPERPEPRVPSRSREETASLVRSCLTDLLGEAPGTRTVADLGLDSLAIADLVNLLEKHHGRTVDPSAVMRARTVEDIAALLEEDARPAPQAGSAEPAGQPLGLSALLRPLAGK